MSTIVWFTFPVVEGTNNLIPICVLEDDKVLGWTATDTPSDVEYMVWRFVESLEPAGE